MDKNDIHNILNSKIYFKIMDKNDIHNILNSNKTNNSLIFFYNSIIESANNDYIYDIQNFMNYNMYLEETYFKISLKRIPLFDKGNIITNKILNIDTQYLYLYVTIYFSKLNKNNITVKFNINDSFAIENHSILFEVKKLFRKYNIYINKKNISNINIIDKIYDISVNTAKNMNNTIIKNEDIYKLSNIINTNEKIVFENDISINEISKMSIYTNILENKYLIPIIQFIFNKSLYDALPKHFINERKEFFLFNGFIYEKGVNRKKMIKTQYETINNILCYKRVNEWKKFYL